MTPTREHPLRARLRLGFAPALIFLIIMTLTLGLMRVAYLFYSTDLEQNVEQSCFRVINVLEINMEKRVTALLQLANSFNILTDVSEQEFSGQSRFVMQEAPDIQAIVNTGPTGETIWMETGQGLLPSDVQQTLDHPAVQVALARADTQLRKFTVSDRMPISRLGDGFVIAIPYTKENRPRGFILALFLHSKLLSELYFQDLRGNFNVELRQGEGEGFDGLYASRGVEEFFFVGDQKWSVRVESLSAPIYNPAYFTSVAILSLGTALAALISLFVYHQQWLAAKLQSEYLVASTRLASTGLSLAQIQENLDIILSSVDEGIILYDEEMQPLQANAVFKQTFLGANGADALAPDYDHHRAMAGIFQNEVQYWALLNNLKENPERPLSDEIELKRSAGPARHFQRRAATVCRPDGSRRGYLVIYQDITATRNVERLKEDFLSSVTHDLRTPLASIKGFAETMLRDHSMDRQIHDEFAGIIRSEAGRLEEMIEDLLDLRRMEDGQMDLAPGGYNLRQLVDDVVRTSRPILDVHELKVDVKWVGLSGQSLFGDAAKIGRAIRNILSNSIKYAPPKSTVTILGRESEDRAELEISDQGPGIPAEDLPHIFEKFYRGGKHVRRTKGTGLGLAIVKHIIDSHGGVVTALASDTGGTTIKIVLPRELERYRTPIPGSLEPLDRMKAKEREAATVSSDVS